MSCIFEPDFLRGYVEKQRLLLLLLFLRMRIRSLKGFLHWILLLIEEIGRDQLLLRIEQNTTVCRSIIL